MRESPLIKDERKESIVANTQLNGLNYAVDGQEITFFDAKGTKLDADRWAINAMGGDLYFEVTPSSMMPNVHGCISDDVKSGNDNKLAMLLLAPRPAVILYLEGLLTRNHLTIATEGPDYVDIPNVDVDGRSLTVRILKETNYNVATADSSGVVL